MDLNPMPPKYSLLRACIAATLCTLTSAQADVKLPPIFSSHMVLQREMAVPVWGTAAPGENVTVTFRGQRKSAVAGQDGKWTLKLDPLTAGGPDTLEVRASNTLQLDDVLVGEVWVGSGQSNMQQPVRGYLKADAALAAAASGSHPQLRLVVGAKGPWTVATPETSEVFSAQLFYFGLYLQKELNVPVGVVLGAIGGTPSGRWLSPEMFESNPACQAAAVKVDAAFTPEAAQKQFDDAMAKWNVAVEVAKQANKPVPRPPAKPVNPREERAKVIGNLYYPHIAPFVPYGIRGVLWDQGESGTAVTGVDQFTMMGALISGWRKAWGQGEFPFIYVQKPSGAGCAWDPANPVTYRSRGYMALPANPLGGGEEIELHTKIMQYPHTAMAISSDLGPGIHPSNKSGYAMRDANVALGMAYGRKIEYYGPIYQSHAMEGSQVRVRFSHTGKGLAFKHKDKLTGFSLAGKDNVFYWAEARIEGDTVLVSSPQVPQPQWVRYGWGPAHPWANLFNQDGLPALPFRTDKLAPTNDAALPITQPATKNAAGTPAPPALVKSKTPPSTVEPATQPGNGYGWMVRHQALLNLKSSLNPDLVFIGDSITHHWGGPPEDHLKLGEKVLKSAFANHRVLNLGFGSDRTQHVLWRLDHGELEGLNPKWVVINIGTNNTSDGNTAEEIMAGVQAVCERVKKQTPNAKIILMAIFPRDEKVDCPRRIKIAQINRMIADYSKKVGIINLDIGPKFLDANGSLQRKFMRDLCHPGEEGYRFWAEALKPYLEAR